MWLSDVFPLLQARVHRYHENELLFNLLAVVPEKPNGGIFGESGSTVQEAQRRKQDYESIAHNIAMILEREQVEILLYE